MKKGRLSEEPIIGILKGDSQLPSQAFVRRGTGANRS